MDVILVYNGLGNQMSQYAFYLAKKGQGGQCIPFFIPISRNRHNGSELEKVFNVHYPNSVICLLIRIIYSLCMRLKITSNRFVRIYQEPQDYTYTPSFLKKGKAWINFYKGGWHCESYYTAVEDEVRCTFQFNVENEDDIHFDDWKCKIQQSTHSVSLHIRRGDFLTQPANSFHNFKDVATMDYYFKSIAYVKQKKDSCEFFVFSDDLDWCKTQFKENGFHFVDCNSGKNSWRDLYLMSICENHINANSTFSWWGAWLSKNKDGIITHPKEFLYGVTIKDFYPKKWIEII